jgi:hypothetical protein
MEHLRAPSSEQGKSCHASIVVAKHLKTASGAATSRCDEHRHTSVRTRWPQPGATARLPPCTWSSRRRP